MRISIKTLQGVEEWHITIAGNFDFEVARACMAEMKQRAWNGTARLVFDLCDVVHLQSCGLGAMLLVAERLSGKFRPQIRCCNETVWAVLQVARMDRQFELIPLGRLRALAQPPRPAALNAGVLKDATRTVGLRPAMPVASPHPLSSPISPPRSAKPDRPRACAEAIRAKLADPR